MVFVVDDVKIKGYLEDLNSFDGYLALDLHRYIDSMDYFNRVSDDVLRKFYKHRLELQYCDDYHKYLSDDLERWVKKNPMFRGFVVEY